MAGFLVLQLLSLWVGQVLRPLETGRLFFYNKVLRQLALGTACTPLAPLARPLKYY